MTAPIFTPGQTIKLTQELELEQEDGFLHILPIGTEVTVTAVFPDEEYWEDYSAVNMDVSYDGDVERVDHYDASGQSDWTESSTGVTNIDFEPNA